MLSDCVHTNSQGSISAPWSKLTFSPGDHASLRSYNILTEGAAPVISAQYFLILAQIIFTGLTELTVTATVLGLCGNTVANLKLRDGAANFTDLTRKLMSGNQGNTPSVFSMVSMDLGPTDTSHLDLNFLHQ